MAWDMYFASIVSMSIHPGTNRENAIKRSVEQCARLADEMMEQRDLTFAAWDSSERSDRG